jgi:hypothetical protein
MGGHFEYGGEVTSGEVHVVWRRVGDHDLSHLRAGEPLRDLSAEQREAVTALGSRVRLGPLTVSCGRCHNQTTWKRQSLKVTLTEPEIAGSYVVAERQGDGTPVLAPDTSIEAIRARQGTEPMSPEDFEEHFGDLPRDGAGRAVGTRERGRLEREGVVATELFGCDPEPRDGTRLAGCVKTYLPQPDGGWGMVFSGDRDAHGGRSSWLSPSGCAIRVQAWQPSVYQVAHRHLNG